MLLLLFIYVVVCVCVVAIVVFPEGTASLDADLVNEVLEDIPQHEEDYLDMTLDEESEVIAQLRSFLERSNTTSG